MAKGTAGGGSKRQWGPHPPPNEKKKDLARRVSENDTMYKPITKDEWDEFDRLLWRYADQFPWYGAAYSGTRRILSRAMPTAAMGWKNGEAVLIANPDFLFRLPFNGQAFILHHEMQHLVREHVQAINDWPNKADQLNFTMDSIINTALALENEFPHDVVDKIHEAMCKMNPKIHPNSVGPITLKHFQEAASNQPLDPKLRGAKWTQTDPHSFTENYTSEELLQYLPRGNDDEDIGSIQTIRQLIQSMHGEDGEFFDDDSVDDDAKKMVMEQMLEEAEKSAGQGPGSLRREIEIIKDKACRDWRVLIRGVGNSSRIKFDRSWFKINKRKPLQAPGKNVYTVPKVIMMIDTSGSIGPEEMAAFIREANNLCTQVEMDMVFIDAVWDQKDPNAYVKNVKEGKAWKHAPMGGGGTQFKEFFDFMLTKGKKIYESCIILTDGYTCDEPYIPAKLARYCFALMTPNFNQDWANQAAAHGFKVAIVDDSHRRRREEMRKKTERQI